MNRHTTKLGVANHDKLRPRVVIIEPWGEDYTLRPGEAIEIVVSGDAPAWFNVAEHEGATGIWIEGGGSEFIVMQDGQQVVCGHNRVVTGSDVGPDGATDNSQG